MDVSTEMIYKKNKNIIEHEYAMSMLYYQLLIIINSTSNLILDETFTYSFHGYSLYIKNTYIYEHLHRHMLINQLLIIIKYVLKYNIFTILLSISLILYLFMPIILSMALALFKEYTKTDKIK